MVRRCGREIPPRHRTPHVSTGPFVRRREEKLTPALPISSIRFTHLYSFSSLRGAKPKLKKWGNPGRILVFYALDCFTLVLRRGFAMTDHFPTGQSTPAWREKKCEYDSPFHGEGVRPACTARTPPPFMGEGGRGFRREETSRPTNVLWSGTIPSPARFPRSSSWRRRRASSCYP